VRRGVGHTKTEVVKFTDFMHFNKYTHKRSEIMKLLNQPYMPWNIYIRDAENLPLDVSTLHGCHYLGIFHAD